MSIYIKTTMRKMPKSCTKCHYRRWIGWRRKGDTNDSVCGGKANNVRLGKTLISTERPDWCPLVEIKERDSL